MRYLPVLAQQAKDAAGQRTFWLMDIALKASNGYAAENLYYSSQAVEFNGHHYEPRLKAKPQTRNTLGTGVDGGQANVDNTDLELGQKILPKERFVEGSAVVLYFAFKLADGTIHADKVFDGEISGAKLSVADNAINIALVGDLYKPSIILGAFPLTQRCVWKFNVNGLLSPDEDECGWQTIQGGDPLACGKTEEDCIAHGNLHRIGAVPFFANVVVQIIAGEGTGSGGFPEFPNGCFVTNSPVLLPDWTENRLGDFRENSPIMSFNESTGELEPDEVAQVHIYPAQPRRVLTVEFADYIIEGVTPEHPAFINFNDFRRVGTLNESNFIQAIYGNSFESCEWAQSNILRISSEIKTVEVWNLSVKKNQTFIVGRRGFHNKPVYPSSI